MKLDLHTHTTYSDGDFDVNGNVQRAVELGLDGLAITDHDNIDSWEEIDRGEYPLDVIKGVELSTKYHGNTVHVLGYYLNDEGDYQELEDLLNIRSKERLERIKKTISLLGTVGINLTEEEVLSEAHGIAARPHIAKAIIRKYPELNLTVDGVFDRYLVPGCPAFVPGNNYKTEDAIFLLKRNHCLVVIAHPLIIKRFDYRELLQYGIDGIEGYYPYSHKEREDDVVFFGDQNHLLVTGGSDYHGPITRDTMGKAFLEDERAKVFLKRIHYKK